MSTESEKKNEKKKIVVVKKNDEENEETTNKFVPPTQKNLAPLGGPALEEPVEPIIIKDVKGQGSNIKEAKIVVQPEAVNLAPLEGPLAQQEAVENIVINKDPNSTNKNLSEKNKNEIKGEGVTMSEDKKDNKKKEDKMVYPGDKSARNCAKCSKDMDECKCDGEIHNDHSDIKSNINGRSEKNDKMSDKLSDKLSDKHSDKMSDKLSDKPSDKMSDKHSDKMSDKLSDKLSDKHSDKMSMSDKLSHKNDTNGIDKMSDKPTDKKDTNDKKAAAFGGLAAAAGGLAAAGGMAAAGSKEDKRSTIESTDKAKDKTHEDTKGVKEENLFKKPSEVENKDKKEDKKENNSILNPSQNRSKIGSVNGSTQSKPYNVKFDESKNQKMAVAGGFIPTKLENPEPESILHELRRKNSIISEGAIFKKRAFFFCFWVEKYFVLLKTGELIWLELDGTGTGNGNWNIKRATAFNKFDYEGYSHPYRFTYSADSDTGYLAFETEVERNYWYDTLQDLSRG